MLDYSELYEFMPVTMRLLQQTDIEALQGHTLYQTMRIITGENAGAIIHH